MISFRSTLTNRLYLSHHVSYRAINSEFLGLINLMISSTYELLLITIMYNFYLSSYCNTFFFFYPAFFDY